MSDIFNGVPERFQTNGVFGYKQVLIRVGDTVEAIATVAGTIEIGTRLVVSAILIEPKSDAKGFTKRISFDGQEGDFNPKRFKKAS